MATQKRKKLTLDEIETQMEVLTKEEMNALKGGTGNVIIDPSGIVAQLKSDLSARISHLESILLGGASMTESIRDSIYSTIKEFQCALNEIKQLEQAEEVYHFSYGSEAKTWNDNGVVRSTVPYGNQDMGLVGHELKHMHQYHAGNLVRGSGNSTHGYDIQDEEEAYRRHSIIKNEYAHFLFNLEKKAEQIRNMIDEKGSQPYKDL